MIVVADTSPLHYLVLVGAIDVLPSLFRQVLIPAAVHEELRHPGAPLAVRQWLASRPAWLEVRQAGPVSDPGLSELDAGEAEAIMLVGQLPGSAMLLMDDARGRREASRRGLRRSTARGPRRRGSWRGYVCFYDNM